MINIQLVKDYIHGLNYKEMIRIMSMYFIFFIIIIGFLVIRHFTLLHDIEQKTKSLNKARRDIQHILTEYEHLKNKKNEVDQILMKDKNFYIKKYYQDIVKELNITQETSSNLMTQAWSNGYEEESLQINFSQTTMKVVCDFLQRVEKNERVFVKNLDITKSTTPKKINVNITIATLKLLIDQQAIRGT